jgi:hypothetical protein
VLLLLLMTLAALGCQRRAATIEIPSGFVGWVTLSLNQESCEGERLSTWKSVISIAGDGTGCSRTWTAKGLVHVRYFYVDADGTRTRELRSTGWGEGGQIWGVSGSLDGRQWRFFVGSESAFKRASRETRGSDSMHARYLMPRLGRFLSVVR